MNRNTGPRQQPISGSRACGGLAVSGRRVPLFLLALADGLPRLPPRPQDTSTEACLRVLMGEAPPPLLGPRAPSPAAWDSIQHAMTVQARFWPCLSALLSHQQQPGVPAHCWGTGHHAGTWDFDGYDVFCTEELAWGGEGDVGAGLGTASPSGAAVPAQRSALHALPRLAGLGVLAVRRSIGGRGLAAALWWRVRWRVRCFQSWQRPET
jgi:hypothetical protein